MKRLIFVFMLIGASLVATTSNAQVYIGGRIGFVFHPHRVFCPPPPVVYQDQYPVAPSYYNNYDNGRVIQTVPQYGYGNYRDRGYEREEYREHRDRDFRGFNDDRRYRDNEEHRGDRHEYRSEEGHRRD